MKLYLTLTFLTILSIMFVSCNETHETPATGSDDPINISNSLFANHGDCLSYGIEVVENNNDETIIELSYSNNILSVIHLNAGFNCCYDNIRIDYKLTEDSIDIKETDINPACDCLCLYNIDYKIPAIKPGIYILKINESSPINNDEAIIMELTLIDGFTDSKSFKRTQYPWGM